jgi:hypothetical protein
LRAIGVAVWLSSASRERDDLLCRDELGIPKLHGGTEGASGKIPVSRLRGEFDERAKAFLSGRSNGRREV